MQAGPLWIIAAAAGGMAGVAAIGERRRNRRRDIDRVGWVPWPGIMLAAIFLACVSAALALKS